MSLIIIIWLATGIYTVGPGQSAALRLFGAIQSYPVTEEGLHWWWPGPIGNKDVLLVAETRRMELGFRSNSGGVSFPFPTEALMISGDLNIVNVQLVVQYNIKNLNHFLFLVDDPGDDSRGIRPGRPDGRTLKDAAEASLRLVVGQHSMEDLLIRNREEVETQTTERLQEIMDSYNTGINILTVQFQDVKPPEEVQDAFDDVSRAADEKNTLVNQAHEYMTEVIAQSRTEATQVIRDAEADMPVRLIHAEEEAARLVSILHEYDREEDTTRRRLYLESMEEILPGVTKFIVSLEVNP